MLIRTIAILTSACLLLQGCASATQQGLSAYNSGNYDLAAAKMNEPAKNGDSDAQTTLGLLWLNGLGSTSQNYNEALAWFTKAAQQGNPYATNNMGVMYENGFGVPKDTEQAVAWYTLAARKGVPLAQTNLARLGKPVPATDLVPQQTTSSSSGEDAAALLLLLGAIGAAAQPAPSYTPSTIDLKTKCTSNVMGSTVYTNCH